MYCLGTYLHIGLNFVHKVFKILHAYVHGTTAICRMTKCRFYNIWLNVAQLNVARPNVARPNVARPNVAYGGMSPMAECCLRRNVAYGGMSPLTISNPRKK
jgi:hypothetical protein